MALITKDAPLPETYPTQLLLKEHVNFLESYSKDKDGYEYVMSEFLRINGVYWSVTVMDLMDKRRDLERQDVLAYVKSCYHPDCGGYGPSPRHDPHILYTLSAVQIAFTFDAVDEVIDREAVADYVISLLNPEDGSFTGDKWGEVDTRFSFCAVATLTLLDRMKDLEPKLDLATDFVVKCMNFDGGFGSKENSESHAGLIYCCVGYLSLTHSLNEIDVDLLGWWLCERQLPSGGLNGRPEKLPDVCYSWWVLASLAILGKLHWISSDKLTQYILACQDSETGGISDRPGDMPDPFHTLFGVAGLSLLHSHREKSDSTLNLSELKPVNPVFCMSQELIDKLPIQPMKL